MKLIATKLLGFYLCESYIKEETKWRTCLDCWQIKKRWGGVFYAKCQIQSKRVAIIIEDVAFDKDSTHEEILGFLREKNLLTDSMKKCLEKK